MDYPLGIRMNIKPNRPLGSEGIRPIPVYEAIGLPYKNPHLSKCPITTAFDRHFVLFGIW